MKNINLLIGTKNMKYQEMLLVASAMITTSNLTINSVRGIILNQPHVLFKVNFPQIIDTVKRAIKYFISMHNRINKNADDVDNTLQYIKNNPVKERSVEYYMEELEIERKEYLKNNK
jgi:hypothetical protein